jgi:hypothetical protein
VLPLLVGQAVGVVEHGVGVVLVDQVGAVAAAALLQLGGGRRQDPLAALPVDAVPGAGEERHVEHPGPRLVRGVERHVFVQVGRGCHRATLPHHVCQAGTVAGEFDDIRGRLEAISEELADLAIERLRESIDAGGDELPVDERRLTRARRAVEKAIGILREPDDAEWAD